MKSFFAARTVRCKEESLKPSPDLLRWQLGDVQQEWAGAMIQEGVFQIYATHGGSYSWWLLDEGGGIIAHAPTQYASIGDCVAVIEQVKRLAGRARLEELSVPMSHGSKGNSSSE